MSMSGNKKHVFDAMTVLYAPAQLLIQNSVKAAANYVGSLSSPVIFMAIVMNENC